MKRNIMGILFVLLLLVGLLSGCTEHEEIPVDTTTKKLQAGSVVNFEHDIDGIKIRTTYDTNGYDLSNWLITDDKEIKYTVEIISDTVAQVYVEHAHLDATLQAIRPQLNGRRQDSMDDSYHGTYPQPGFLVTKEHSYSEIFHIEGFSKDIFEVWGTYVGEYGTKSGSTKTLGEKELRDNGVYGTELTVVYNLMIRWSDDEDYYTVPFSDSIAIPLNPDWTPIMVKDNP